jgi:urea transporter
VEQVHGAADEFMKTYTGIDIYQLPDAKLRDYMSIKTMHTLLYLIGLFFVLALVILEETIGLLSIIGRVFACLLCIDLSGKKHDFERKLDKFNKVEPVNVP